MKNMKTIIAMLTIICMMSLVFGTTVLAANGEDETNPGTEVTTPSEGDGTGTSGEGDGTGTPGNDGEDPTTPPTTGGEDEENPVTPPVGGDDGDEQTPQKQNPYPYIDNYDLAGWVGQNTIEVQTNYSMSYRNSYTGSALENYTLSSSDATIVSVNGITITALKEGTATITLTPSNAGDEEVTYTIVVYNDLEAVRQARFDEAILEELQAGEIELSLSTESEWDYIDPEYFAEIVKVAKENGIETIKFNVEDKIIWEFATNDITDATIKFIYHVTISTEKPEAIENDSMNDSIFIDFAHSGKLPGKAKVSINVGTEKYGEGEKTLGFYYYNPETKAYEYVSTAKYANGMVTVEIDHCSTYALNEKVAELDDEPKTGKNSTFAMSMFVLAIVSLSAYIVEKK